MRNQISVKQLFTFASLFCLAASDGGKQIKLYVLDLMPFAAVAPPPAPLYGLACQAASLLAATIVNNRSDVLPDYFVNLEIRNEEIFDKSPTLLGNFSRSFEDSDSTNSSVQSPLMIGPFASNGCKAVGRMLHHVNTVAISNGCGAALLADHAKFPNLYLTLATGNVFAKAAVHFLEKIGEWRRMAVMTNAEFLIDYETSQEIVRLATEINFTIPIYNIVITIDDDMVTALKKSDIRIIIVWVANSPALWSFLCQFHKFGISGPRYVFMTSAFSYVRPNIISAIVAAGCSRETILSYYRQMFWVGAVFANGNPNYRSELGYNSAEFDAMLDAQFLHSSRPPDYDSMRFICHDATLIGLLSLNDAEEKLRKQNLSLKGFSEYPQIVMKAFNESVRSGNHAGLRIGPMKYSSRGQFDDDIVSVGYWTEGNTDLTVVYTFRRLANASAFAYSEYALTAVRTFNWEGWGSVRPKDGSLFLKIINEVPGSVLLTIIILSIALWGIQISATVVIFIRRNHISLSESLPFSQCLCSLGCILLNSSAVAFATNTSNCPLEVAYFRIVLLGSGLSLVHGVLALDFIRLSTRLSFNGVVHFDRRSLGSAFAFARSWRSGSESVTIFPERHTAVNNTEFRLAQSRKDDRNCAVGTSGLVCLLFFYFAFWFGINPINCRLVLANGVQFYDEKADQVIEVSVMSCKTANYEAWILAAAFLHVTLLAAGGLAAYQVRNRKHKDFSIKAFRLVNALTILIFTIVVLVIIRDQVSQRILISFASLAVSGTTTSVGLFDIRKRLFN